MSRKIQSTLHFLFIIGIGIFFSGCGIIVNSRVEPVTNEDLRVNLKNIPSELLLLKKDIAKSIETNKELIEIEHQRKEYLSNLGVFLNNVKNHQSNDQNSADLRLRNEAITLAESYFKDSISNNIFIAYPQKDVEASNNWSVLDVHRRIFIQYCFNFCSLAIIYRENQQPQKLEDLMYAYIDFVNKTKHHFINDKNMILLSELTLLDLKYNSLPNLAVRDPLSAEILLNKLEIQYKTLSKLHLIESDELGHNFYLIPAKELYQNLFHTSIRNFRRDTKLVIYDNRGDMTPEIIETMCAEEHTYDQKYGLHTQPFDRYAILALHFGYTKLAKKLYDVAHPKIELTQKIDEHTVKLASASELMTSFMKESTTTPASLSWDKLLAYSEGNYQKAWSMVLKEIDFYKSHHSTFYDTRGNKILEAKILEKLQRYSEALERTNYAIAMLERERALSNTKESFFYNTTAKDYQLLIRINYGLYSKNPNRTSFSDMIKTTEMLRSRTFKEERSTNTEFNLDKIQGRLAMNEAVIGYMDAGEYYLAYVITHDQYQAYKLDTIDQIKKLVKAIKPDLENINSDTATINGNLQKLSKLIINPFLPLIQDKSTLYLLTDSELNQIPFELLTTSENSYYPMIQSYSILLHPSISYIKNNQPKLVDSHGLLVIANPMFIRNGDFISLPETQIEAKSITKYFPTNKIISGKEATLDTIMQNDLSQYNYLHFATHGILGYEIPGITEPALVLSQVNGKNTFLTVSEVKKLKLKADITVLSACNTGSGKYSTGEGVMGIGQAFLSAGSKSVVMSLWPVPSQETVQLMSSFYSYINQGKETADALRQAKLDLIKNYRQQGKDSTRGLKRKSSNKRSPDTEIHPFYWAPFVIIGS